MDESIEIGEATTAEREWCARLMAASEPWITLRRGYRRPPSRGARPGVRRPRGAAGRTPCGFIRIHPRGVAGSPYVASVAVAETERGRGVGTALLDATEARYPKARYVFLCVSSFNTRARELYERHGYRLVGELPDYVVDGYSELLMGKRLA